ncbi:MAG: response regulator [Pseudomonadota bacterium]
MCDREQIAIAIVDADSAVRDSFYPLLEGVGYSVCAYATGTDLLEALSDCSPSVLLLGSQLPDINAHLLLKRVYELGAQVPAIILANHSLELPRLEDMVPGPSALLLKPVDEAQLFAAIEKAINFEGRGV